MAYNKFITQDGIVALDLTEDTITAETLEKGITAHDKYGVLIVGTMESEEVAEYDGSVVIEDAVKTVTITVNSEYSEAPYKSSVYIKLGSKPTSDNDYDITVSGGETITAQTFTVAPVAYLWSGYNAGSTGYKINNGSLNSLSSDSSWETATEIQLSDGDTITLVSCALD